MGDFGQIKKVSVRKHWANEQHDFTPWLAQEENIAKLGEALGLELEVENVEAAVGPYSADILARDIGTDRYVVIENQFGKTNHDHLGKLITYGAVLDAGAIVWLTETFTEEHHRALDWLNDNTADELAFFGVVLELWQIDKSRPAIRFNVVSRPPESGRKAAVAEASGKLTETKKLQLDFWTSFRERLLASKVVPSAQSPRPQYWFDVPLGRAGIHLSAVANTWDRFVGIRVYLSNKVADAALPQLEIDKDRIEEELGESLMWNPNPENRDKTIALQHPADIRNREAWPENCDWLVDHVANFRKVFVPRVKRLDLSSDTGKPETDEG